MKLLPEQIKKEISENEEYVGHLLNKFSMKLVTLKSEDTNSVLSEQLKLYQDDVKGEEMKKSRQPIFKSSILIASDFSGKEEEKEKKAKKRHIEDYVTDLVFRILDKLVLLFLSNCLYFTSIRDRTC